MKRILLVLLVAVSLLGLAGAIVPQRAAAFNPFDPTTVCDPTKFKNDTNGDGHVDAKDLPAVCSTPGNAQDPISGSGGIILKVVSILSFAIGVASVVMVMIGGLRYILANGDANAVNGAKNQIIYALVGLVVAAVAQSIIVFVINRL